MNRRLFAVSLIGLTLTLAVVLRLWYWQIVEGDQLAQAAQKQYRSTASINQPRGDILASDGFPLVSDEPVYSLIANPAKITNGNDYLNILFPLVEGNASPSASRQAKRMWSEYLSDSKIQWLPLAKNISSQTAQTIADLKLPGISLENSTVRDYPESSMAAQLLGFVGSDKDGYPKGYFGLEGYYDRLLAGTSGVIEQDRDAQGNPIMTGTYEERLGQKGKDLVLYMDRGAQFIAQTALQDGLEKYGASAGTVTVMDPETGGILAMASLPTYDPTKFENEDPNLFPNPVVSESFEPGSIFKPIVMAAAINEHAINADTICDRCSKPWSVGGYTIHTWNDK